MKLLRAARALLNEVTIFDGHPDLVAQRQQQAKLGSGKPARIGGAKEQYAERLLLGLQANPHDGAQALARGKLPEAPEGFFALECCPGRVAPKIAENDKPAQSRNHIHEMIVEALFLGDGAEIFR